MPPLFNTLYRHRNLFFSSYEARPSFRDITGYHLMLSIPRDPSLFSAWLANKRDELDGQLAAVGVAKRLPYGGNYSQTSQMITEVRPDFGRTWMDWTYELDLDTLVFSFMAEPMFRLDRMPPPDACERYITQDHYGLWTCTPDVPDEYTYRANWARPPAPAPTTSTDASVAVRTCVPVHELLDTSPDQPDSERVCTRLYEVIFGQCFREYHHGFHQCLRPGADGDGEDAEQLRHMLLSLLWPAMMPMIYTSESPVKMEEGTCSGRERRWPRSDTFFQVCVGIQSASDLHATASTLATELQREGLAHDRVLGVLFSGSHVALVCVGGIINASQKTTFVSCSDLLQFLPDRFGPRASTPGIDALIRLGQSPHAQLDRSILYRLRGSADPTPALPDPLAALPPSSGTGTFLTLPRELLMLIVDRLDDSDLHAFAVVSHQTHLAVRGCRRVRYPVIDKHRLVRVQPLHFTPQTLPNGDVLRSEEFHELAAAAFVTEDDRILMLGFNPGIDMYLVQINCMVCYGSGTITMPHVLGRQIRIPYIVLDRVDVAVIEADATSETLLGRICRRGRFLVTNNIAAKYIQ
ncbi:hypothetical protein FOMPIDRAFT_115861 [Fomitopsis schrenkii]|uniref:F-box domain-containing protein n=1 Tax=Fomitopsis schrenkii TaxID=2126942 RepID=S8FEY3_FOMSC|nr:hypothetical protein FOMPIDRAFT_115861 [Fomitopsis schrenkii]